MKVMTILGTRPEIIKLSMVLKELDKTVEHIIVHTGQNFDYELNEVFFNDLALRRPDYFLNAAGNSVAESIANIIARSDEVMAKENPDALLLYGDTNSCLSIISAKRRKIPIFHMEAGNRCFDQRVPEEINRKIVDHLADINMVLTEHARGYLEREGIPPERIVKTGSSMKEVLDTLKPQIASSTILDKLGLIAKGYFLVSAHREEVVDTPGHLRSLIHSLTQLIETYHVPVILSTHPRTRKQLDKLTDIQIPDQLHFSKPFGLIDYIHLQMNALCTLSDSGTITEESSILHFPAVTLRNAHERPEGNDQGTLIMCGYEPERVLKAVETIIRQREENPNAISTIPDYNVDCVAQKVVRLILSYTPYINEKVWFKQNNIKTNKKGDN